MSNERRDLIFRVFVSSTFEDLKPERNSLQKVVFPKLREYCRQRNARFQAVDLRWGVSEEASYNQQTMSICLRELERCQQVSPRPNFIVLLGNRYGWVPLPASIEAEEFEQIEACPEANRPLLKQWYRLDKNSKLNEYCLLPREGELKDADQWRDKVEKKLRKTLQDAAQKTFPKDDERLKKYFWSATHQEINHGALHEKVDAKKHALACFRDIQRLPDDRNTKGFSDLVFIDKDHSSMDTDPQKRLKELKGELTQAVPKSNIYEYTVTWGDPDLNWEPPVDENDIEKILQAMPEKLRAMCMQVQSGLERIIDDELQHFNALPALNHERDSHREFGLERCQNFVGREDVLDRIKNYLASDEQTPLVIHGPSGFGKTALMAEAWRKFTNPDQAIARFIGATPGSADLRTLLRSLCTELGIESPPEDTNELIAAFQKRLSGAEDDKETEQVQPAIVFLDAMDQLNETDNARILHWLPRTLSPGVKLVFSVLDDEGQRECYDIASRNWPDTLTSLGHLSAAEAEEILKLWLTDAGRKLQPEQHKEVLGKFAGDGGPLFLKLAFEQARRWKSWEVFASSANNTSASNDIIAELSTTVAGLLEDLFTRLEHEHDQPLVAAALGYIAAAKNGLTEGELMDILSRNQTVLDNFIQNSPTEQKKPPKERLEKLPLIVWSRLFADIENYMTHRRADGTVVMNFYHRQVTAAVHTKYLNNKQTRLAAHKHLAEYFDNLKYWAESLKAQQARSKRLPPTPRPANVRKVVELPYHRLEAAKLVDPESNKPDAKEWDDVADLLTNWQFLEAKAEANPNYDPAKDNTSEATKNAAEENQA